MLGVSLRHSQQAWPRLAGGGAVQILSTVPTVDWVLLGSGESNKG